MKHNSLIGLSLLLLTTMLFSFLSSCYEPIEGCIDPLSDNFQLDADGTCDECCTYPSITVQFNPMWDTIDLVTYNRGEITIDTVSTDTSFLESIIMDTIILDTIIMDSMIMDTIILDSIIIDTIIIDSIRSDTLLFFLTNDVGQQLRISESQFFVSNIYLTGSLAGRLSTQDSVILECDPPEVVYNTLGVISFDSQEIEIEDTALDIGYDILHVGIGISDCLASIDTIDLTNQIPSLENLSLAQISDNEYLSLEFTVEFGGDSELKRVYSFLNSEASLSFSIAASDLEGFSISRGNDLSIEIDVNYAEWFKNILSSDNEDLIKQKLIQNSTSAFSLRN